MKPTLPFLLCNLVGYMTTRALCLAVSRDVARGLLPAGLELDDQALTPAGTHPLAFHFSDILGAQLTVPSLLPSLTYCELIVSLPFVRSTTRPRRETEPWSYLPRLF